MNSTSSSFNATKTHIAKGFHSRIRKRKASTTESFVTDISRSLASSIRTETCVRKTSMNSVTTNNSSSQSFPYCFCEGKRTIANRQKYTFWRVYLAWFRDDVIAVCWTGTIFSALRMIAVNIVESIRIYLSDIAYICSLKLMMVKCGHERYNCFVRVIRLL